MKKALIMAGYESSGMGNLINNCSFENFDLSHFKSNDSLYENMKTVYSICKSYTREFTTDSALVCGGSPNLIMTGATGLGKTHLSAAIAKGLIDRGYDVVYDTAVSYTHLDVYKRQAFKAMRRQCRNDWRSSIF